MDDWIIGVILALFVIIPCWLALARRKEVQRQVEGWSELTQRTGLIYAPGYPLSVRGEYRGRYLSITLITFGDTDNGFPLCQNTRITLNVRNSDCLSISIQAQKLKDYIRRFTGNSNENFNFDKRFSIRGSPHEYLQKAVDLIVRSGPRLPARALRNYPSIELKGDTLICNQNGELTNVDDQLALLNLLCDLAELAEKMGNNEVEYAELRREESD